MASSASHADLSNVGRWPAHWSVDRNTPAAIRADLRRNADNRGRRSGARRVDRLPALTHQPGDANPPMVDQFRAHADDGPIVILNPFGCKNAEA
jgi:hypothetical protein